MQTREEHLAQLQRLQALQRQRPLTPDELTAVAGSLRAIDQPERAEQALVRAARLRAAAAQAPPPPPPPVEPERSPWLPPEPVQPSPRPARPAPPPGPPVLKIVVVFAVIMAGGALLGGANMFLMAWLGSSAVRLLCFLGAALAGACGGFLCHAAGLEPLAPIAGGVGAFCEYWGFLGLAMAITGATPPSSAFLSSVVSAAIGARVADSVGNT